MRATVSKYAARRASASGESHHARVYPPCMHGSKLNAGEIEAASEGKEMSGRIGMRPFGTTSGLRNSISLATVVAPVLVARSKRVNSASRACADVIVASATNASTRKKTSITFRLLEAGRQSGKRAINQSKISGGVNSRCRERDRLVHAVSRLPAAEGTHRATSNSGSAVPQVCVALDG